MNEAAVDDDGKSGRKEENFEKRFRGDGGEPAFRPPLTPRELLEETNFASEVTRSTDEGSRGPLAPKKSRKKGALRVPRLRGILDPAGVVGLGGILGVWWGLSSIIGRVRLPSPAEVTVAAYDMLQYDPRLAVNVGVGSSIRGPLWFTTEHALVALLVGSAVGVGCGIFLGWSWIARQIFEWPLEMVRVTPPLIATPFLLFWFGIGSTAQFVLVSTYSAFILAIGTLNGVANVAPVYRRFGAALGASEARIYRKIVLPAMLPELIGPMRVANASAWGLEIVAELLGAQAGMGRVFNIYLGYFNTAGTIAGILWLSLLAVITDRVIYRAMRFLTRWKPVLEEMKAV